MAKKVFKMLRGLKENLPELQPGQQALTYDTQEFYAGTDAKNVRLTQVGVDEVFPTVADMKSADTDRGLKAGSVVRTQGYYKVGAGGHATYKVVADNTGTDDGGSYHDFTNLTLQAELITNGTVNVKQFGAKGDGVIDDTIAFQKSIDFVSKNGGAIFLPNGRYKITNSLNITSSQIKIFGEHKGSTYINSHTTNDLFKVYRVDNNPTYVVFKDLHIVARQTDCGSAFYLNHVNSLLMENVNIEGGNSGANQFLKGINGDDVDFSKFRNVRARDCRSTGCVITTNQENTNVSNYFKDCFFAYNDNNGLELVNQRSVYIINTLCNANGASGLFLYGNLASKINDATIIGGEFDSNDGFGINLRNYKWVSIVSAWVSSGRINNCAGAYIRDCSQVSITDLKTHRCGAQGLLVENVDGIDINGGWSDGNATNGLEVTGTSDKVRIMGVNTSEMGIGGEPQVNGIYLGETIDNVILTNCISNGNSSNNLYAGAITTFIRKNNIIGGVIE